MPRYSAALRSRALDLYAAGSSAGEVAAALDLKRDTVKQWLRTAGVGRSMSEAAAISVSKRPRGLRGRKIQWCSPKADGIQIADSGYEAARMQQLDADDRVVSWERCRDRIAYTSGGKRRVYIPDLSVTMRDGSRIVEEIKPIRFKAGNEAKWRAARAYYSPRGIRFLVVSEDTLGAIPANIDGDQAVEDRKLRAKRLREKRNRASTPEEIADRRSKWAAKARRLRGAETSAKRETRLQKMRDRGRTAYHNESPTKRTHRKKRRAAWERMNRRRKGIGLSEWRSYDFR